MPFRPASGTLYTIDDFQRAADGAAMPEGWQAYSWPRFYAVNDCDLGQLNLSYNSRTTHETCVRRIKAMKAWLDSMGIWYEFSGTRNFSTEAGERRLSYVYVRTNPQRLTDATAPASLYPRPCPACDETTDPFQDTCGACGIRLECAACHNQLMFLSSLRNGPLDWAPEGVEVGQAWMGCSGCFTNCAHRDEPIATTIGRRRMAPPCGAMCQASQPFCSEHSDPFICADCQHRGERRLGNPLTVEGVTYCELCSRNHCGRCGTRRRGEQRWRSLDSQRVCPDCYQAANAVRIEVIDRDVRMTAADLLIPSLPERPTRLVSIEQEFDQGNLGTPNCSNTVANQLYGAGLSCYSERMRYHSGGHTSPSHVERDASVESGGELIYNRLNLADPTDAEHMAGICTIIQAANEAQTVGFTAACGTHIHIDLHGYTIADARNYVTLYSYLEDVIFRLGSAGYGDHRSVVSSSGFAVPIRKDKWGNLVQFGVEFLRNANHTDSLNMQHFYASLAHCTCGAIEFGNIEECRCVRPKCTAEWRVFNGTGNPRKLHAWVSFVQALTSWCQNRELDLDAFEPLGFEREIDFTKDMGDAHANLIEAWRPRLEWIWGTLPLSDPEKASIMYCIKNSPLKHVGEDFLTALATIEREPEAERELELVVVPYREGDHQVMGGRTPRQPRFSWDAEPMEMPPMPEGTDFDAEDFDEEEPF